MDVQLKRGLLDVCVLAAVILAVYVSLWAVIVSLWAVLGRSLFARSSAYRPALFLPRAGASRRGWLSSTQGSSAPGLPF